MSATGKSMCSSMTSCARAPQGTHLNVPGRMVPTCGRATGTVMTAIILPPTAGSTNSMSVVPGSQTSSVASEVQPVPRRAAKRGAKSRPLIVPPTMTAVGRYFRHRTVKRLVYASLLK